MGGVSAFGALVAGLEPTFFQGSDASRAVDTPPSICTSLGVKMGPKEGDLGGGGCLPPVCVCLPVTWVTTSGREGGPSAVARSNPRPRPRRTRPRPTLARESGSGEGAAA